MSDLDYGLKEHWAITLQIPAFKKIRYEQFNKQFDKYTNEEQKNIIRSYFEYAFHFFNIDVPPLYFELHKDGRIHCHTYIHIEYDKIYEIQQKLCVDQLKIRPKQFQQVFNFFRPDNIKNWVKYCQKTVGAKIELEYDLIRCGTE